MRAFLLLLSLFLVFNIVFAGAYDSDPSGCASQGYVWFEGFGNENLVGYWDFDETSGTNAEDYLGNNNGTLNNMDDNDWITGVYGNALDFDGTNDYVVFGTNIFEYQTFTVSAWIKSEDTDANSYANTITHGSDANYYGWRLQVSTTQAGFLTVTNVGGLQDSVYYDSDFTDWHHFVGVRNGTTNMYLYIDGELAGTDDTLTSINYGSDEVFRIGMGNLASGRVFDGQIDELRIYDTALSQEEINTIYRSSPYFSCCGDDGSNDDFYNGTVGVNATYCWNGFIINDVDLTQRSWCESNSSYDWIDNLNNGLVSYWRLDEPLGSGIAIDSIRNNNGSLFNDADFTTTGRYDNALAISGDGGYISIADHESLNITDEITVSAWVKYSEVGNYNPIINKQGITTSVDARSWLLQTGGGDRFGFYIMDPDSEQTFVKPDWIISADTWYHVTGTYKFVTDGTSELKIYVNGFLENSVSNAQGPIRSTNQPIYIGRWGSNYANGVIDEVRIYDRVLSDEEIMNLYHSTPHFSCCGDDGLDDDFYNGTVGIDAVYCWNGFITTDVDETRREWCEANDSFLWFNGEIGGNASIQNCCGDDGLDDDFMNLTKRCVNGSPWILEWDSKWTDYNMQDYIYRTPINITNSENEWRFDELISENITFNENTTKQETMRLVRRYIGSDYYFEEPFSISDVCDDDSDGFLDCAVITFSAVLPPANTDIGFGLGTTQYFIYHDTFSSSIPSYPEVPSQSYSPSSNLNQGSEEQSCITECSVGFEECCSGIYEPNGLCITCYSNNTQASNCGEGYGVCESACGASSNCDEVGVLECISNAFICDSSCSAIDRDLSQSYCEDNSGCNAFVWDSNINLCCGDDGLNDNWGDGFDNCCCKGSIITNDTQCDSNGDLIYDSVCLEGVLSYYEALIIRSVFSSESYVLNDNSVQLLVDNVANSEVEIYSLEINNLTNYFIPATNPGSIGIGGSEIIEFTIPLECNDLGKYFNITFNISYVESVSGNFESVLWNYEFVGESPIEISLGGDPVQIDVGSLSIVSFDVFNNANSPFNHKIKTSYPVQLSTKLRTADYEMLAKDEFENYSFVINPKSQQRYDFQIIPAVSGSYPFSFKVVDQDCETINIYENITIVSSMVVQGIFGDAIITPGIDLTSFLVLLLISIIILAKHEKDL